MSTFGEATLEIPEDRKVFFKIADGKHGGLEAGLRTKKFVKSFLKVAPEMSSSMVQWTEAFLSLDFEHRFFILDGEVFTGSPYLVGGTTYSSRISWARFQEALDFARIVAKELVELSPNSYTLDVALNRKTNSWVVVEANRTWASGLYDADPLKALVVIEGSITDEWSWTPDPMVQKVAKKLAIDGTSAGVVRLSSV